MLVLVSSNIFFEEFVTTKQEAKESNDFISPKGGLRSQC